MLSRLFGRRGPDFSREAGDAAAWVRLRLARPALYTSIADDRVDGIRRLHPREVDQTLAAAERVMRHEFDLLGSGAFVPADPDRPARSGYAPIDWYLDPVRGLRFPRGIPCGEWDLYKMRPANADIKYPWELARCQHWAVLGQAFRLTRDERFAREIAEELDDFVDANPVGVGVNWTCTMDEAIRAANWAIGLELVRDSTALDAAFWRRAFGALFDHGVFIRDHLENTYEVTSNHFLSNVVGLWFLGAVFEGLASGDEWTAFARTSLEQEIDVQVLPDGADFESSVPYHRLVTELFLGALRLGDVRSAELSPHYRARVRNMVAYLAAVVRPDGLMPQVGDADDGRLHVLGGYGTSTPQDGRHVFGPAGAMYDEPGWTCLAGSAWETAWWGLEPGAHAAASTPAPAGRLFRDAGVAVMRAQSHYLLVTNGIVGTKGFGNHKHNDQLSFEYHCDGTPLIVDAGSYVYTSDFDARNAFRCTAAHNTLGVDDVEQNEMKPEWIFRMFEAARPEHVAFDDRPDAIRYVGTHHGYERLGQPVAHQRELELTKATGALRIVDRLTGAGSHRLRWHFHLAPGAGAAVRDETTIELRADARSWVMRIPAGLQAAIVPARHSPSYGVAVACHAVTLSARVDLADAVSFEFIITP